MYIQRFLLLFIVISSFSCSNVSTNSTSEKDSLVDTNNSNQTINTTDTLKEDDVKNDSTLFISSYKKFIEALNTNNVDSIQAFVNFPLYGTSPFTGIYTDEDKGIDAQQFKTNIDKLFDKKAKSILNNKSFDQFSMFDKDALNESYSDAKITDALWSNIDKGSYIAEAYIEYAQDGGQETNQSYLFGKINGTYKLIALTYRGKL